MSNNNPKKTVSKGSLAEAKPADSKAAPQAKTASAPLAPVPPVKVPPLFRRIDWVAFAVTSLLVFIGYYLTLAPDLTLEDCGELATGSFYAGVPHPPGYPVWTVYTWLFTVLVPVSNIAYRVALSSAFAGAVACGLIALMVSRGSSMMIEGIGELKNIERRWENGLCIVAGFVAGMLLAFNGFMWSQAVIVEVYTLSVLSLAGVLICLMRWIYAPHQRRYLYFAFFWFGICFNNHQSLLVTAMGIEVAVLAVSPRLGRDILFWNVVIYLGVLGLKMMNMVSMLNDNVPVLVVFHLIGIVSAILWVMLLFKTKKRGIELLRDFLLVLALAYLAGLVGHITHYVTAFEFKTGLFILFNLFGLGTVGTFIYLVIATKKMDKEWISTLISGASWAFGAGFYLYMALASMSNPPLNWGYPRTVTGFIHAFTRGQYERIHPTHDVVTYVKQFYSTIIEGTLEEFNFVYVALAFIPFLVYRRMQPRERAWLVSLTAIYICLGPFLLFLLSPGFDRQSRDLNKVFFTASHVLLAMLIGYGVTIGGALLATQYDRFKRWAAAALGASCLLALYGVAVAIAATPNPLVRNTALFSLIFALIATAVILLSWKKAPMAGLIALCAIMPAWPILSHWEENEQHGHLFGYWFGHDMFTPPFRGPDGKLTYDKKVRDEMLKKPEGKLIYPEMDRDTVLFGGTDPGRFNPTYMIFCESFIPPSKKPHDSVFDRRDVYLITQNALADGTYLSYIRAHYNRSAQIDPPFFQELTRGSRELEQNYTTNILARLMVPVDRFFTKLGHDIEKNRRADTSFFQESDFVNLSGFAARLRNSPSQDKLSKFIYEHLKKETQELLSKNGDEKALRRALVKDLNGRLENEFDERERMEADLALIDRSAKDAIEKDRLKKERVDKFRKEQHQLYDAERFQGVKLSDGTDKLLQQNPASYTLIRLDRLLLEDAYPELARSIGGVYPDREILTPTNEDSQRAFQEYLGDAQRRLDHDKKSPNEPRQIKPGEDVRVVDNRVQVSGQVAVMAINGLLTKVIFDKNPNHEFYVEESFPLDWMYPYLTPYGIIMKINRQPLAEMTDDIVARDHKFWSDFSERLVGNWITYDTTVTNICAFAEKVYHRRDYKEFKGDPKFVRDNDAQKAFSKLRSSISGVYAWRLQRAAEKGNQAEYQRMLKEAEFSFKQAYVFCPYSPEAVFRYINLLISLGPTRIDDARLIAVTSQKLDPNNSQMDNLISELDRIKQQQSAMGSAQQPGIPTTNQIQAEITQLEKQFRAQPSNLQVAAKLVTDYLQVQQNNKALPIIDALISNPQADANMLLFAAQVGNQLNQMPRVEQALAKLVKLNPENPEGWFDLAGIQAVMNKQPQAVESLREALRKNASRSRQDKTAPNLYTNALTDPRFGTLRQSPEFQSLIKELEAVPR